MDFTSALKQDLLRPLATLFVPATIAVGPSVGFQLNAHSAQIVQIYHEHETEIAILGICALFIIGMLLENIGSHIESHFYDKLPDPPIREQAWIAYLKNDKDTKPAAIRYIGTVVTRLKFELSMISALFLNYPLGILSADSTNQMSFCSKSSLIWLGISIMLAIWQYFEARNTVKLLDQTRRAAFNP